MTYLQRYQAGEHVEVWSELMDLGAAVCEGRVYSDAWDVACETMRRARANVETIVGRLTDIGHVFGSPAFYAGPILAPPAETPRLLNELEEKAGPLPLSLRAWWQMVGAVDLRGLHAPIEYSDPLMVYPLDQELDHFDRWEESCKYDGIDEVGPFHVVIAPDYLHKDQVSGSSPYSVQMPQPGADALLEDEWHNTTFVNYLRICFRSGGFPGFERATTAIPVEYQALAEGLLPI